MIKTKKAYLPDFITDKDMTWVFVDLDGTIFDTKAPQFILEEPMEGAKKGLRTLRKNGYKVIIYTARHWADFKVIREAMKKHKLPFDFILAGKPLGLMYIDDKGFRLTDWNSQTPEILKLLNKQKNGSL